MPSAATVTVPFFGSLALLKVNASPSASVSFTPTFAVTGVRYGVVATSFTATGTGLVTPSVKVVAMVAPVGSFAVTVTVYGPPTLADLSSVPEITPVTGSMLKPFGRPVALKSSLSPFGSLKLAPAFRLNAVKSTPLCAAMALTSGPAFCTVIVTVAVAVAPSASFTW